jgi:membrane protease YdiL (CAAX protease family)
VDTPPPPPRPAADGKSGATFALALAPLLVAGAFAQVAQPLAGLLWTELFAFLIPALVATEGAGLEARAWLRLRPAPPRALILAGLVGVTGWFTGSALFGAVRALAPAPLVERFDLSRLFGGPLALQLAFAVAASVVAPLCEEVAFRGHLASALHSRHRPAGAIAASAALFALLHLDPLRGPSLLLLGALYGWLAWRSGSIWPAVVAHAVNNAVASALALTLGAAPPSEEPALAAALGGVAIGALAVALAVAAFQSAVPSPPPPGPLPILPDAGGSTRFRPGRISLPLRVALVAGWIALGAILASRR